MFVAKRSLTTTTKKQTPRTTTHPIMEWCSHGLGLLSKSETHDSLKLNKSCSDIDFIGLGTTTTTKQRSNDQDSVNLLNDDYLLAKRTSPPTTYNSLFTNNIYDFLTNDGDNEDYEIDSNYIDEDYTDNILTNNNNNNTTSSSSTTYQSNVTSVNNSLNNSSSNNASCLGMSKLLEVNNNNNNCNNLSKITENNEEETTMTNGMTPKIITNTKASLSSSYRFLTSSKFSILSSMSMERFRRFREVHQQQHQHQQRRASSGERGGVAAAVCAANQRKMGKSLLINQIDSLKIQEKQQQQTDENGARNEFV